jgi:hypothetical protein
MDALSDLLRVVRFSGGIFLEVKFRAPWCVLSQVQAADCGPGVKPDGGMVAFHYVLEGHLKVRIGDEAHASRGLVPRPLRSSFFQTFLIFVVSFND